MHVSLLRLTGNRHRVMVVTHKNSYEIVTQLDVLGYLYQLQSSVPELANVFACPLWERIKRVICMTDTQPALAGKLDNTIVIV